MEWTFYFTASIRMSFPVPVRSRRRSPTALTLRYLRAAAARFPLHSANLRKRISVLFVASHDADNMSNGITEVSQPGGRTWGAPLGSDGIYAGERRTYSG